MLPFSKIELTKNRLQKPHHLNQIVLLKNDKKIEYGNELKLLR